MEEIVAATGWPLEGGRNASTVVATPTALELKLLRDLHARTRAAHNRPAILRALKRLLMTHPHIKTELPGPKARALLARDAKVVSPSYPRDYPFVMSHGAGTEVWDVDGNRFLDFMAGIAVCSTGHSHPVGGAGDQGCGRRSSCTSPATTGTRARCAWASA